MKSEVWSIVSGFLFHLFSLGLLVGICVYCINHCGPVSPIDSGKERIDSLEGVIDTLEDRIHNEEMRVDTLYRTRTKLEIQKEIEIRGLEELPLDSGVELLRKNIEDYEADYIISSSIH